MGPGQAVTKAAKLEGLRGRGLCDWGARQLGVVPNASRLHPVFACFVD